MRFSCAFLATAASEAAFNAAVNASSSTPSPSERGVSPLLSFMSIEIHAPRFTSRLQMQAVGFGKNRLPKLNCGDCFPPERCGVPCGDSLVKDSLALLLWETRQCEREEYREASAAARGWLADRTVCR